MVNEIIGLGEGIDAGQAREDVNKIGEDARRKVQEDNAKAKKIAKEIKKSKQDNDNIAKFMALLLQQIQNEKLISLLYETFFKVKNPKNGITYFRKNINSVIIVGFFVPFYYQYIKKYNLTKYFADVFDPNQTLNIHYYIDYVKKLANKYHDNIPLDIDNLINFIIEIALEFNLQKMHRENRDEHQLKDFFMQALAQK